MSLGVALQCLNLAVFYTVALGSPFATFALLLVRAVLQVARRVVLEA